MKKLKLPLKITLTILIMCILISVGFLLTSHPKKKSKTIEIYPQAVINSTKNTFKVGETIKLNVNLGEKVKKSVSIPFVGQAAAQDMPISVKVENMTVQKEIKIPANISSTDSENYSIKIDPKESDSMRPGVYTAYATLEKDGATKILEQPFFYGVLAINTNKSVFTPHEKALIQMAALNSDGHTLCDAPLELTVKSPSGTESRFSVDPRLPFEASTKEGKVPHSSAIERSPSCGADNVTDLPDYTTEYETGSTGTYTMTLENTKTGYKITDTFEVRDSVPLVVERVGATRINPFKSDYTMHINITPSTDFKGEVVEQVPGDFKVINTEQRGISTQNNAEDISIFPHKVQQSSAQDDTKDSQKIVWTVDLKKGQTYKLEYTYQAPKVSPEWFFLGPLSVNSCSDSCNLVFKELRSWQIASDGTCTSAAGGGNWGTGGTWGAGCTGAGGIPAAGDVVTIGNNATVTGNTTVSIASLTISNGATLTFAAQSPTITLTGTTGPVLSNSGTYTAGSETILMTGVASMTVTGGSNPITLNILQMTVSVGTSDLTYTFGSQALTANSSFTINNTRSSGATHSLTVSLGAALTVAGTTSTAHSSKGTVSLDTSASSFDFSTGLLNIASGDSFSTGSSNFTVTGTSGTLLTCGGTCTTNASHVVFNGNGSVTLTDSTAYNFGTIAFTPTITANRTYTFGGGAIFCGAITINPTDNSGTPHTLTVSMGADINASSGFPTITIQGSGSSPATGKLDATGSNFNLASGRLDIEANGVYTPQGSTVTLSANSGTIFTLNGGTFTPGTSTVSIAGQCTCTITVFSGSPSLTNLSFNPLMSSSLTPTYDLSFGVTVSNNLSLLGTSTSTFAYSVKLAGTTTVGGTTLVQGENDASPLLATLDTTTSNHAFSTGFLNVDTRGTFTANNSTITLTGTSGTLFTRAGTFTAGGSTVDVAPASGTSTTLNSGAISFNNLTIDAPSSMAVRGGNSGDTVTIASPGNLTINSGTLQDRGIQIVGNSSGTLTILAGAQLDIGGTQGTPTFPSNFTNAHISLATTSTVNYNSNITMTISSTPTYGNLKITQTGMSADSTYTFAGGTTTINGNFTIVSGSLVSPFILNVNMGGNIAVASGKTTTMSGNSAAATTVIFDTISGQNYSFTTGNLDIEANGGTAQFKANNSTITVSGNFTNNGTFTAGGSTVIFNDNSQVSTITGATTFNNFTSTTASKTIKFQKKTGSAPVFTFGGTFLMQGASSILRSDTDNTQWLASFSSPQSSGNVTNTTITDSGCSSSQTVTLDGTNTNGGNNDSCWSFGGGAAQVVKMTGGAKIRGGSYIR